MSTSNCGPGSTGERALRFRDSGLHASARSSMEVLYPRYAGLDVHARSVTACVRLASGSEVTYQHRTVSTTTHGLLDLADWLAPAQCTHVAMEATGVCWKPVWHILDQGRGARWFICCARPTRIRGL